MKIYFKTLTEEPLSSLQLNAIKITIAHINIKRKDISGISYAIKGYQNANIFIKTFNGSAYKIHFGNRGYAPYKRKVEKKFDILKQCYKNDLYWYNPKSDMYISKYYEGVDCSHIANEVLLNDIASIKKVYHNFHLSNVKPIISISEYFYSSSEIKLVESLFGKQHTKYLTLYKELCKKHSTKLVVSLVDAVPVNLVKSNEKYVAIDYDEVSLAPNYFDIIHFYSDEKFSLLDEEISNLLNINISTIEEILYIKWFKYYITSILKDNESRYHFLTKIFKYYKLIKH